ncbi:hypothetical protein [Poseidonibacter antarcticus]|uniref:hypothetical protein n=1 Tax=Poseidonibacter antarcticus TaxID=2478538 RepID=UPI000EF48C92|nr:hypothetical protein [Poseidonibacter antarcticus]
MKDLINQLKSMKNATTEQYEKVIDKYAYDEVVKDLKDAGLSKDEIPQSEFDDLLKDKVNQARSFSKGAMVAGGAILFLELLG